MGDRRAQPQQRAVAEGAAVTIDQPGRDDGERHGTGQDNAGGPGLQGCEVGAGVAHALGKHGHGSTLSEHLMNLPEALENRIPRGPAILGPGHGDGSEGGQEGPQRGDLPERRFGQPARATVQERRGRQRIEKPVAMVQQDQAGPRGKERSLLSQGAEPDPAQEARHPAACHLRPAAAGAAPTRGPNHSAG